jgi:uncharacterized protein YeaO (DUF488 family)
MIQIKRVYDPTTKEDGARFLVERLWPRGMKKEALHMDAWCKNLAPSGDLRRWFGIAQWGGFSMKKLFARPYSKGISLKGCLKSLIQRRSGLA